MHTTTTVSTDFPLAPADGLQQIHATTLDGQAHYFFPCIPN
jgi:hypothetical protein